MWGACLESWPVGSAQKKWNMRLTFGGSNIANDLSHPSSLDSHDLQLPMDTVRWAVAPLA